LEITSSYVPVPGGLENSVASISKELARRGHKVTVLTTQLYDPLPHGEAVEDGVNVIRCANDHFAFGYGFSLHFIRKLRQIWRDYDLVHVHGYNRFASEYSLFYLRGRLPMVFTAHGFVHTKRNYPLKLVHESTAGKSVVFADVCTALTPLDRPRFEKLGVPDSKIVEVPNGVDVSQYSKRPPKSTIAKTRKAWGVLPGEKAALFVGRIHASKGLQFAVKALVGLPKVRLVLVGKDSGYSEQLAALARECGVLDRVVFTGGVDGKGLSLAYPSADFFVIPSEWEGFGLVVVEAMAAGLPVIASDRGALPHVVRDGLTGLICPYADVAALRAAIKRLSTNPSESKAMGKRGKAVAVKNYSWSSVVDKLEAIYNKLYSKKKEGLRK
jgi:glycosyltransferase involved in cell wall biosynthesis